MADGNPKTRVFFEEGVSVKIISMDPPDDLYVIDGRLTQQTPSEVYRAIMKLEFHGRNASDALVKQEAYEGELTIEVGFLEGEEEYKLYIYDDNGNLLDDPYTPDELLENDGRFPEEFENYFVFELDEFPDPNIGAGP